MRIVVMGAGAVGCYFGGMMALAGHAVTLIARPLHVEAIRRDGLLIERADGRHRVHLAATEDPAAVTEADLVLFCVKSTDTEPAGETLRPHLRSETAIWSLQNGVDNAERLARTLGRPVSASVVYVAAGMAGPGHVRHHGRGELIVEPGPGNDVYAAAFTEAGLPVTVSRDVATALWTKLVINCAYNAISAIAGLPYGSFIGEPGVTDMMRDVVDECGAVAAAVGVSLPDDLWPQVRAIAATMKGQMSSTALDLARGRPTEIDHLNGYIVTKGAALGVATPVNRALLLLVRLRERAAARPEDAPEAAR
ncbi:ketopantoate reductase [Kaistia soli DSM 19436]|uniref:2-dehydropantoate 2-reductase n=1 Tax=Kaistia soli DSM 19436 TaxID=1122133 RepID=A0A1M4XAS2_9HYPH|nr:ketopantoate reductase family protein [Kaistia soli]SHE90638.1 ketopantoate reductase [Kaistia soli DSM 19436]